MEDKREIKQVGLTLPLDVLCKGKERAAGLRMKFSHYVGAIIERDYEEGGDILIKARPAQPPPLSVWIGAVFMALNSL
jgi:hypothetical protein